MFPSTNPTPSSAAGRFCWYELATSNADVAKAFYTRVMGWGTHIIGDAAHPYLTWTAGGLPMGGIASVSAASKGVPPHWKGYVAVDDVDATTARVLELGGLLRLAPHDIAGAGRQAIVADPTGATVVVFKAAASAAPPRATGPGTVSWNELYSTDPARSLAFFSALFGWQKTDHMDLGPMGTYQMYGLDGQSMGGIMKKPESMPGGSAWFFYVTVADLDASIAAFKAGGGTIMNGPMEVPGGDVIAQGMDPEGAFIALHIKKG